MAHGSFYYDKTHRGNDWEEVRKRLKADITAGKKSEVQATDEMLALLKDKYTRWGAQIRFRG